MGYWAEIAKSAAWKALLFFFDDPKKALITFVLVTVVTTLMVLWLRSKEAFKEYQIPNIAIPIPAAICTWLLVFAYYLLISPGHDIQQIRVRLAKSESNERSAIIAREGAVTRATELDRQKNVPVVLHGACRVTEAQLNPARVQPSCPAGTLPLTLRDRVVAINARLTESDRNRFSDALAEFEKSLTDGRDLFYKINEEGGKFGNDFRSGSVANSFSLYEKSWADLTDEGWKYQKSFPLLRTKWQQQFDDQTQYIFGDNPDNQGPTALINATSVYKGFLQAWKTVPRSGSIHGDYFLGLANNEYQVRMKMFGDWNRGCFSRLTEMRDSIR
jgi:hypothetical protein